MSVSNILIVVILIEFFRLRFAMQCLAFDISDGPFLRFLVGSPQRRVAARLIVLAQRNQDILQIALEWIAHEFLRKFFFVVWNESACHFKYINKFVVYYYRIGVKR